jgi:hypothetical protein
MQAATDKAMEEALAIANEATVAAGTTAAEPASVAGTDGESVGAVTDMGGYPGNGDASSTPSPSERSSTVAVDEGLSYSENGEGSDATTVVAGGAEGATGGDDVTTGDEAAPADEPPDEVTDDAEAANDWVTTADATATGEAVTTADEATATDEQDIAGETTHAADAMTTADEADATQSIPTDQNKTVHGWFSPTEVTTANSATPIVDEATDELSETAEAASRADGAMIADEVEAAELIVAGEAATMDGRSGAGDVDAAGGWTAPADEAIDESVETEDGAAGLIIAGEAATMDGRSGAGDVTTADDLTATERGVTDESTAKGDGAMRVEGVVGATGLIIAADAATTEEPSRPADVMPEDDSTTIEADADVTDPILVDEPATTDQPSGTDKAATEDEETTTIEAVLADRVVASDEAETPDQGGDITDAAPTVDDTTTIIPAVRDEPTTLMAPVPDDAATIIPAVPDDIPVVPPLGRLRLADQSALRESGKQTTGSGTGAAALHAATTSPTETAKPKATAVPVTLPAPTSAPATPVRRRPRRARLKVTRADPWSVMKIAFMLSLAAGIMTVVAVAFLWMALDAAGVFSKVGETVNSVTSGGEDKGFDLEGYLTLSRVLGITGIIAAVEVVVMTALATLLAFMYNVSSGMVGGVEVTLAEDD